MTTVTIMRFEGRAHNLEGKKTRRIQLTIWGYDSTWELYKCSVLDWDDDTIGIANGTINLVNRQSMVEQLKCGVFDTDTGQSLHIDSIEELPALETPSEPIDLSLFPFCEEWETTVSAPAITA